MIQTLNQITTQKIIDLFNLLRNITYKTVVDGAEITVNAELFTVDITPVMVDYFIEKFGSLEPSNMSIKWNDDSITTEHYANFIKTIYLQKWGHILSAWTAVYNPMYNVDGTETREVITDYGKIITMDNGKTTTTAHTVAGSSSKNTSQSPSSTENKISAFNSSEYSNSDFTTNNVGDVSENTTVNDGTHTTTNGGTDTESNSGNDKTTENIRRYGNIGVTMTQQLLTSEVDFWGKFKFFDYYFDDISNVLTIPIWGD